MSAPTTDRPMLARRQLRLAVVAALQPVCENVFSPGNWPTSPEALPVLKIGTPSETKTSKGRNTPEFDTATTLVIQGQVEASTAEAAQDSIEALAYRTENAVLKDYSVNSILQQFLSVSTDMEITSDGKRHLAGFRMTIVAEMFEAFDPMLDPPADSPWPVVPSSTVQLSGVNLHVDSTSVFDSTGTYPSPAFPASVQPAPRTSGPDGRDEGSLQINLPQ